MTNSKLVVPGLAKLIQATDSLQAHRIKGAAPATQAQKVWVAGVKPTNDRNEHQYWVPFAHSKKAAAMRFRQADLVVRSCLAAV